MSFNPNELILEKIRAVEEYDIATNELTGRYTQIEEPSLQTSAEGTQVTDAMGAEIATFYNSQTGKFSFSNSLFSLDLAASQFGGKKETATDSTNIIVPVSEVIEITQETDESTNKTSCVANLTYTPVGDKGKEVAYAKIINNNNTFGETYTFSAVNATTKQTEDGNTDNKKTENTFVVDAENRKLIFPEGTKGRVFVQYNHDSKKAVRVTKKTDSVPEVRTLIIHALFRDPCKTTKVYAGVIHVPRAQINPESVEVSLKADGKHAAEYKLQKQYCDESAKLFDIIVSSDEED